MANFTGLCSLIVILSCTYSLVLGQEETKRESFKNPLANSVNDFGFKLLEQIGGQDNIFISPFSIYTALALVHLGAGGQTAQQLEAAFELEKRGLNASLLREAISNYMKLIRANDNEYSLLLANGLFVQQNFTINTKYVQDAAEYYDAAVQLVNFLTDGENTKNQINSWVAENTRNKIPNFLSTPVSPSTVMAILNAIYFKGIWKTQFNEDYSTDGFFYKSNGETKKVKYMMHREAKFRFLEDSATSYKFLELPYEGEHISMLLALPPTEKISLDLKMTNALLCRINNSLVSKKLQSVVIPKFKLEFRKDLKSDLNQMGISNLFTPSANLSAIRKENDLFVSEVKHASVIEVNEQGSEAAAVTGVFITRLSLGSFEPDFVANHPFLFYIFDRRNGMVLFSGRLSDP